MLLPITILMASQIGAGLSTLPARQPQLAAAHRRVAMAFGTGSTIWFTQSADQGATFSTPVRVAEVGALALGRHRGPRVVILPRAILITAVVGERTASGPHAHGLPEAGNLAAWRSVDEGRTWTRAGVINDVPGAAREGLHAMAADRKGNVFAAWLDLRAKGTRLYGARSVDGGLTWSTNREIYASPGGTICQCCHPSLAFGPDGRLWVMWRNVVDGSRDLYAASSRDGRRFDQARKLGEGTWKLNACPMDGGAISASGKLPLSAWRREGSLFLAEGDGPERRLGAGKDVALVQTARGPYVAWTGAAGLEVLRPGAAAAESLSAAGGFVSLISLPGGAVLAAWETGQSIETKRLD